MSRQLNMLWMTYVDPVAANASAATTLNRLLCELTLQGHRIALFHSDAQSDYTAADARMAVRLADVAQHRVPGGQHGAAMQWLFRLPLAAHLPDRGIATHRRMLSALERHLRGNRAPDVIVSWSQLHSIHLAALSVKRRTGIPWIACLSDPWTDEDLGYEDAPRAARPFNKAMERAVIGAADAVVFTTEPIRELVMGKYPASWLAKSHVHVTGYDPALYQPVRRADRGRRLLKHVGALYGQRSAAPLVRALAALGNEGGAGLAGIEIQFIGHAGELLDLGRRHGVPADVLRLRPPVSYLDSLGEMVDSDLLICLEAPTQRSVFLPSKLVDYAGSATPIWCIGPDGPAAEFTRRCGGTVSDVRDPDRIAVDLQALVRSLPSSGLRAAPEALSIRATTRSFTEMVRSCLVRCRTSSAIAAPARFQGLP